MPISQMRLVASLAGLAMLVPVQAPKIVIDGDPIDDTGAVISGKAYIPLSLLAKKFGAEVDFRSGSNIIRIKSGASASVALRNIEGIKNPDELNAWFRELAKWYERSGTLFSLVDESRFGGRTDSSRRLAESFALNVKGFKKYRDRVGKLIDHLKEDPYDLVAFEQMYEFLSDVSAKMSEIAAFGDNDEITGAPDTDINVGLIKHATAATELSSEILSHRMALLTWYLSKSGRPKW